MTGSVMRTICYRAFCDECLEIVSPDPRMTKTEAKADLRAHAKAAHKRELGGGNA